MHHIVRSSQIYYHCDGIKVILIGCEPLSDSVITHQKAFESQSAVSIRAQFTGQVTTATAHSHRIGKFPLPAPDFWRFGSIQDVTSSRKDLTQIAIDGDCDNMTSKLFIMTYQINPSQPCCYTLWLWIKHMHRSCTQRTHKKPILGTKAEIDGGF